MEKTESAAGWLGRLRNEHGVRLRQIALLNLLLGWCIIGMAFLLAWILDQAVVEGAGLGELELPLLALPGLVLLRGLVAARLERQSFELGLQARHALRRRVEQILREAGPAGMGSLGSADVATRLVEGIEALHDYFARYLPHMSQMTLVPLSILLVVLPLDWISAVVLLVTAPLIPVFMILVGKGAERANQKQWQRLLRLGGYFLDLLRGLVTLKAYGLSQREVRAMELLADDYRSATLSVLRIAFLSSLVLEFLATVSIALVAVLIGFRLLWGDMDYLRGLFILLLAPEFYLPLRTMGAHYHARLQAVAAAETLQALEALPRPLARSWSEVLPRLSSVQIQCEGVRYRYPGRARDALSDASLTIPPAALTVLIGPSGAGKSTLARLLLGFDVPQGGDIFVNGCNLATAEPESWRSQCGWLPQQPVLLAGSIRENIAPGEDEPDASRLWEALALVELDARVRSLPEGLDTRVGQGGRGLSGGEMRRLALARLFYTRPAFVVLDEPTASLDAETEAVISRAISELARNHTVLVIAHRLQTLREADHLVMMEAGRVVAEGSPEAVADRVPAVGRLLGSASRD